MAAKIGYKMFRIEINKKKRKIKGRLMGQVSPPQNKLVQITEENKHLISFEHNGMLLTEDGSLLRTPQYDTFQKDIMVQLKKEYETAAVMPEEIEKIRGRRTEKGERKKDKEEET